MNATAWSAAVRLSAWSNSRLAERTTLKKNQEHLNATTSATAAYRYRMCRRLETSEA
jgi:hypothetical protein